MHPIDDTCFSKSFLEKTPIKENILSDHHTVRGFIRNNLHHRFEIGSKEPFQIIVAVDAQSFRLGRFEMLWFNLVFKFLNHFKQTFATRTNTLTNNNTTNLNNLMAIRIETSSFQINKSQVTLAHGLLVS